MKRYTTIFNGGIGKHICGSTLLRYIQEKEPDAQITVISGYPEVFLNNPRIYRNLHFGTSYVFDDYIKGTDLRIGDPYPMMEYYQDEKHLSQLMPKAYRFEQENENIYPELYIGEEEQRQVKQFAAQSKNPIITVQVTGGNQMHQNPQKDPKQLSPRDLLQDSAQKIVDICVAKGFNVLQVALPHEYHLKNVMIFNGQPFRSYIPVIPHIVAHIGIDSAMMHAVAAFKKPALIFWNNTNVKALGYPNMVNIHKDKCPTPMCSRPHVGMPDQIPEGGWKCPHNLECQKWTLEEIEENVSKFLESIPVPEKKPPMRIPLSHQLPPNCPTCPKDL
jgi:hypothetical protein